MLADLNNNSRNKYLCVFGLQGVSFFIFASLQNRAFMIGTVCSVIFVYYGLKVKSASSIFFRILIFIIIATFFMSTLMKLDSSFGRLFIYKISFRIFIDHLWWGVGIGKFKLLYNHYQSEYFSVSGFSMKEFLIADNVFFAFNDYFEFLIEIGIIRGSVCLGLGIYILYKVLMIVLGNQSLFSLIAISGVIAIFVGAFFTHVFELLTVQIYLSIVSLYIVMKNFRTSNFIVFALFLSITTFAIGNKVYYYLLHRNSAIKFEEAKLLLSIGHLKKYFIIMKEIYPFYKSNIDYLRSYSSELINTNNNDQALLVLDQLKLKRIDSYLYLDYGKVFEALEKYDASINAYQNSINMVPNRFTPRYRLFKLFIKLKDYSRAVQMGKIIMSMPVKVSSIGVANMKADVELQLKFIKSLNFIEKKQK